MSTVTIDSTGSTAVDNNYFWQPIETCPRGVKVQLIGDSGVAMYGTYNGKGTFYTHWAPLPKFKRDVERCHGCEACIQTACGRDECPKGWVKP